MLTRLRPVSDATGDRYTVSGTESAGGIAGNWWLDAYAICAPAPAGYGIVSATTPPSSSNPRILQALCPVGKKVVGTGAQLVGADGQVGIATVRTFDLNQTEAVAVEDADGTTLVWTLAAYAVCVEVDVYAVEPTTIAGSWRLRAQAICAS
ncbi:hypothetical protein [Virgisporangium aurantiacum]|uniref:Uncharacterized protein n=1 Tax=Virgisporangium aurantiacum TaxID=175570 RepID=A0A8J3ZD61_9ACTN|nr:hypothetical protein [Virgisporangium aurantiacum]GIJ60712.1 hypothetical protein Vau01_082280 [Virgisporangium aurantiacum]